MSRELEPRLAPPLSGALLATIAAVVAPSVWAQQTMFFGDGFDSGDTAAWGASVEGMFSPPTALASAASLDARGETDGDSHVIPKDHMSLRLAVAGGPHDVLAMAAGTVRLVLRTAEGSTFDYEIYIQHSAFVTSQFDHLEGLASGVLSGVDASDWTALTGDVDAIFFGEPGLPAPPVLTAGAVVGWAGNDEFIDIGVIDTRYSEVPIGTGPRRYPSLLELTQALGVGLTESPFPGHRTLNSRCFLDLLGPLDRATWQALLTSSTGRCGRSNWDVAGTLQGVWFNPGIDGPTDPPMFDVENAAFALVPDFRAPETKPRLGFGSGPPYGSLDPTASTGHTTGGFVVSAYQETGQLNLRPSLVTAASGVVCYDLLVEIGLATFRFDVLFVRLESSSEVSIRYDPVQALAPACSTLHPTFDPADFDVVYTR